MAQTSNKLTKWLIKLGADVRRLQHQAPYLAADMLAKEINRYQQTLQFIYAEANKQKIDLLPYYSPLAEIEANLKLIEAGHYSIEPVEKIALFIDGANLYAVAHDQLRIKIDYARILTYFSHKAIILRAFYYIATDSVDGANLPYLVWLKRNGYQVVTKPMKEFDDGGQKGNLDIEIAIDMLELADKVDRVVLFSGDGDFAPLLRKVGTKGTRTQVVSYWGYGEGPTAPELLEAADIFTDLKDIVSFISKSD
jgi:uncharacterized LabA/DUF88 family protein